MAIDPLSNKFLIYTSNFEQNGKNSSELENKGNDNHKPKKGKNSKNETKGADSTEKKNEKNDMEVDGNNENQEHKDASEPAAKKTTGTPLLKNLTTFSSAGFLLLFRPTSPRPEQTWTLTTGMKGITFFNHSTENLSPVSQIVYVGNDNRVHIFEHVSLQSSTSKNSTLQAFDDTLVRDFCLPFLFSFFYVFCGLTTL